MCYPSIPSMKVLDSSCKELSFHLEVIEIDMPEIFCCWLILFLSGGALHHSWDRLAAH